MAREDIELKGEIIGELEDIDDPETGRDLLDALLVERVEVLDGQVTVVLVFGDAYPKEQRWAIEDQVNDAVEAIEGVKDVNIQSMTRSAFEAEEGGGDAEEDEEASAASEPGAREAESASAAPEAQAGGGGGGGLSMYSGGGCGAGTVAEPEIRVKAPAAAKPVAAAEAPAVGAPAAAPAVQAAALVVAPSAAVSGQQVVLSLADYTVLVQAQRELELRPSLDEHTALKAEFRLLQSRVQSLQDAIQALMQT